MTFHSTEIVGSTTNGLTLLGQLTIKETTRPVRVNVELNGFATDPWGQQRIAMPATTEIDREDFGITLNTATESGGVLIGKTGKIEIEVEAARQTSSEGNNLDSPRS